MWKPSMPFNVSAVVVKREYITQRGMTRKEEKDHCRIFCSFKSYGGSERTENGKIVVEDTAVVETWWRSDLTEKDALRLDDGRVYDIMSPIEDIELRKQFIKFKVKRTGGGA